MYYSTKPKLFHQLNTPLLLSNLLLPFCSTKYRSIRCRRSQHLHRCKEAQMGSRKRWRYGWGSPTRLGSASSPRPPTESKQIGCPCSRTASPLSTPELDAWRSRGCGARWGDAAREVCGQQCSSRRVEWQFYSRLRVSAGTQSDMWEYEILIVGMDISIKFYLWVPNGYPKYNK